MIELTVAQLMQLGRKCSMCDENAVWLDKLDENAPAYCDRHFPFKYWECEE